MSWQLIISGIKVLAKKILTIYHNLHKPVSSPVKIADTVNKVGTNENIKNR